MADSYIIFFRKCWDFLTYIIDFFRGKKQDKINTINNSLQNEYDKIDQNKEDNKQDDTENRLNNLFK